MSLFSGFENERRVTLTVPALCAELVKLRAAVARRRI